MRRRQLLWVVAAACTPDPYAGDTDRDGVLDYNDCAPRDPLRFPGNVEVCDGRDNDCDRKIDEDLDTPWYVDADGDGHGDPRTLLGACSPQTGRVPTGGDCDDADPTTFPGAPELCDGIDNDCQRGPDDAWWRETFGGADGVGPTTLLAGDAAVVQDDDDEPVLRLTRGATDQAGGVWLRTPVPGGSWRLAARVRVRGIGPEPGEGVAFVFAAATEVPIVGVGGAGLGVYGAEASGLAFEIDLARSGERDTTAEGSHLGFVDLATGSPRASQPRTQPFADEGWHAVEYTQDDTAFEVRIDGRVAWHGDIGARGPSGMMVVGISATTSRARTAELAIDDVEVGCGALAADSAAP